jgi:hypothetical protein
MEPITYIFRVEAIFHTIHCDILEESNPVWNVSVVHNSGNITYCIFISDTFVFEKNGYVTKRNFFAEEVIF